MVVRKSEIATVTTSQELVVVQKATGVGVTARPATDALTRMSLEEKTKRKSKNEEDGLPFLRKMERHMSLMPEVDSFMKQKQIFSLIQRLSFTIRTKRKYTIDTAQMKTPPFKKYPQHNLIHSSLLKEGPMDSHCSHSRPMIKRRLQSA